jgi:hypothetical protein
VLGDEVELCGTDMRGTRFQNRATSLNVSTESLYAALVADAENLPPNFNLQGRQVDAWKQYRALICSQLDFSPLFFPTLDYLPVDSRSTAAGSANTRVVSRALEVHIDSSHF